MMLAVVADSGPADGLADPEAFQMAANWADVVLADSTGRRNTSVASAVHKERLLIDVLGPLGAPETVAAEVLRKAHTEFRHGTRGPRTSPRADTYLPDDSQRMPGP